MLKNRRILLQALAAATVLPVAAFAQGSATYPSDTVRMVVPYAAGGATDIVARAVADKMTGVWSKPVVIDNKPGAGTTLAAAHVARAPGDGHTLYMTTSAHTISASIYKKLDYNPVKDFAPLTLVAKVPLVLVVRPSLNVRTLTDFIKYVKANPEKASYASPGNGTAQHLAGEMFNTAMKTKIVHVPYRGDAPAITDLMGGTVDAMFATLTVVIPHIESGKLQAIAIANGSRVEKVPTIPTFTEAGLNNFEFATWFGVFAPASVPKNLRDRISKDIQAVVLTPEMKKKLVDMGGEVVANRPEEFEAFVQTEARKWQEAVRISGAEVN
ncbi:MFS transporter [Acidovorax carolinensis]|uniref:MFS transporter n=1 Tax=Acidovorax carolinensis TaxID=553814 RepID=A0A240UIZ4_9BURK|nr:tripartite tricarboxylate transporter substrate binding protein [Acidovorax carolinensis]ART53884.1 MFS transporter [Acidovorax carolinensis]ART61043.1 MFS transporter [Acidovorax carolinensis]